MSAEWSPIKSLKCQLRFISLRFDISTEEENVSEKIFEEQIHSFEFGEKDSIRLQHLAGFKLIHYLRNAKLQ